MSSTMKNYASIQNEWERQLPESQLRGLLIFGSAPIGDRPETIARRKSDADRFEKRLVELCNEFGFDVKSPMYDGVLFEDTGKLSHQVAEQLVRAFEKTHEYCRYLAETHVESKNSSRKLKPGPARTPSSFAEYVLVGLEAHRNSARGLELLRKYISPNGGLERSMRKKRMSSAHIKRVVYARGEENIKKWATTTRQSYERMILSAELGRDVKSFARYGGELRKLRARISARASEILRDAKKSAV